MTRKYELMLVLRPDFGVEEKPISDLVKKLMADRKVESLTVMGKKRLAYVIKKQTEGVYAVATVTGAPVEIESIEKIVRSNTDVLRYLLTVQE